MWRALWSLVVLAALTALAVWMADNPGTVSLHWQGYRIDTSFVVLLVAVAFIAAATAIFYRLWTFLRRAPTHLNRARHESRRRRGYLALTKGMVAVAAGDSDGARRQVKRADGLLIDPPLTMLLSAQAAQLSGDEKAAGKFFTAMLERPETEFLGLRGLLTQSMKRGDSHESLRLAQRAFRLRPKSDWVATTLFDLQAQAGQWIEAGATLGEAMKNNLIPADRGRHRKTVLAYQSSVEAAARGERADALKRARKAHEGEPGFMPAAALFARLLMESGRARKAVTVIEDCWARQPHPDLLDPYWAAREATEVLDKVRAAQRLAKVNPDHDESRLAVATAALEANLWGEARKHLETMTGNNPSARVCRKMAELEESEHGDLAQARSWLVRATTADPDSAWVCEGCGNAVTQWSPLCGNCGTFDGFSWRTPRRVVSLLAPKPETTAPKALPAATEPTDPSPPST